MGKLDFSGLDKIAYKHFEDKPGEMDSLLKAGFTIVDNVELPFPQEQEAPAPPPSAFTDHTGETDYKQLYRVAYAFHKKYSPPLVDKEYWKTHTPGEDDTPETEENYWNRVATDMAQIPAGYHNAPLLWAFMGAICAELEREYKAIRDGLKRD